MISRVKTFAQVSLLSMCVISVAAAETSAGHPRVNEVSQRLANQQRRIAEGAARGQVRPWQAARDERRDERIARQLARDEALHDGHITWAEQQRLNQELDRNSVHIGNQRHFDETRMDVQVTRP